MRLFQNGYRKFRKSPLKIKCKRIFITWSLFGVYIVSFILANESDPIGLLPIVFILYLGLWLLSGLILISGIGVYYYESLYRKSCQAIGIGLYVLAILAAYPILDKYYSKMSYKIFYAISDYNLFSMDTLVNEWRTSGSIPWHKGDALRKGLTRGLDLSSDNIEWLLVHCHDKDNSCFGTIDSLLDGGNVTTNNISNSFRLLKNNKTNLCEFIKVERYTMNFVKYPKTPMSVLYELRNQCKDNVKDLDTVNWWIEERQKKT